MIYALSFRSSANVVSLIRFKPPKLALQLNLVIREILNVGSNGVSELLSSFAGGFLAFFRGIVLKDFDVRRSEAL